MDQIEEFWWGTEFWKDRKIRRNMKTIEEILTNKEIEEIEQSKNILGIPDFETIDYNLAKHWNQYGIGLYNEIRKNQLLSQINEKLETIQIVLEERI